MIHDVRFLPHIQQCAHSVHPLHVLAQPHFSLPDQQIPSPDACCNQPWLPYRGLVIGGRLPAHASPSMHVAYSRLAHELCDEHIATQLGRQARCVESHTSTSMPAAQSSRAIEGCKEFAYSMRCAHDHTAHQVCEPHPATQLPQQAIRPEPCSTPSMPVPLLLSHSRMHVAHSHPAHEARAAHTNTQPTKDACCTQQPRSPNVHSALNHTDRQAACCTQSLGFTGYACWTQLTTILFCMVRTATQPTKHACCT